MKIAILGCGPAGLLAAHAAAMEGHRITVISKRRKSEMYGAQYLHRDIPGLNLGDSSKVAYELDGLVEGYKTKVYGHEFGGKTSVEEFSGEHESWDIRLAYTKLWNMYFEFIAPAEFTPQNSRSFMQAIIANADLVINSMPRPVLCYDQTMHKFPSRRVWAIGDAPERGIFAPSVGVPEMTVRCNGWANPGWYRASNVYGYRTVEWATEKKPPVEGIAEVHKPLMTDCTCWPTVQHVGRYGEWKKGVLAHHAFEKAARVIQEAKQA